MATLNEFLQRGKPSKRQLNIIDIFNIKDLLQQRGFQGVEEGRVEDTLLQEKVNAVFARNTNYQPDHAVFSDFIERFSEKSFRQAIRAMVFDMPAIKSSKNINYTFKATIKNQKRYSNTVELLIAYLCVKELKALSASYGVRISGVPGGGDFDCIANFQNAIIHFEIKSGEVKNISRKVLQSFLNRHHFLAPNASVLFLDFQGHNSTTIDELVLKFSNLKIGEVRQITSIQKISDGSKAFYMLNGDIMIVDLNSNDDLISNLRSAVQYFHRFNAFSKTMAFELIKPSYLGYKSTDLWQTEFST